MASRKVRDPKVVQFNVLLCTRTKEMFPVYYMGGKSLWESVNIM